MLSEDQVIGKLRSCFPDGKIFYDEYNKKMKAIPTYSIHTLCKLQNVELAAWLEQHGFSWHDCEKTMAAKNTSLSPDANVEEFVDWAYENASLLGNIVVPVKKKDDLFNKAQRIFYKLVLHDGASAPQDEKILIFETIQLLKSWDETEDNRSDGDNENTCFWDFIFKQYCGYTLHNDKNLHNKGYTVFRRAIINALRNKFCLSTEYKGKRYNRYYTTLMSHALAPKQSLFNFFNVIFDFYATSLDYQYSDYNFANFVEAMNARWNNTNEEEISIRSDSVSSGLRSLFETCPHYMAMFCRNIIEKIDAITDDSWDRLHPNEEYIDLLLHDWYLSKSKQERFANRRERINHIEEKVATTKNAICPKFIFDIQNGPGLAVPKVRFGKPGQSLPAILLYNDENLVFSDKMPIFGNEVISSYKYFLWFRKLNNFPTDTFRFRIEIKYDNNVFYDSNQSLCRKWIVFDSRGRESSVLPEKEESIHLFVPTGSMIRFDNGNNVRQLNCPGQLFSIEMSTIHSIKVDHTELYVTKDAKLAFRSYTTSRCIKNAEYFHDGQYYDIFRQPFELELFLPADEHTAKYQMLEDQLAAPLEKYFHDDIQAVKMDSLNDGKIHTIKVFDIQRRKTVYELQYIILDEFSMKFDKLVYQDVANDVSVEVAFSRRTQRYSCQTETGNQEIIISMEKNDDFLKLQLPTVCGRLFGKNMFAAGKSILWSESISAGEILQLQCPSEWSAQVFLGNQLIPYSQISHGYEVGNYLRTYQQDVGNTTTLSITLHNVGDPSQFVKWSLATIALDELFYESPLEIIDGQLFWYADENFVGNSDTEFSVRFDTGMEIRTFESLAAKSQIIDSDFTIPDGIYSYIVTIKKKAVFARTREIEYRLIKGDSNLFRFQNSVLRLKQALCWDWRTNRLVTVDLNPSALMIRNFHYCGLAPVDGEIIKLPKYTATIMFWNSKKCIWVPFNSNSNNEQFELINPVSVWIINDHILTLLGCTQDAVYVDKNRGTILNIAERTLSRDDEKALMNPDNFEYEVETEREV